MLKYNEFWGWLIKIISIILPPIDTGSKIIGYMYKPFIKGTKKNILIPWRTNIFSPNKLTLGNNIYLGYNSYYGQGEIIINDNVLIGPFVSITPSNHIKVNGNYRNSKYKNERVVIEKNVWIGAHVSILSGVIVGEGSIVAAGSVVTKSVPKNTIVAGVPAKVVKYLN
jgi:maltose O-acetyltransferase